VDSRSRRDRIFGDAGETVVCQEYFDGNKGIEAQYVGAGDRDNGGVSLAGQRV